MLSHGASILAILLSRCVVVGTYTQAWVAPLVGGQSRI